MCSFRAGAAALLLVMLGACGGGGGGVEGTAPLAATGNAPSVLVTPSASNSPPVSNAGTAQSVLAGSVVTLDGSFSSDPNADLLAFRWTLITLPEGSSATLVGADSAKPTFKADVAGIYVASLIVNDGQVSGSPSTVTVTTAVVNADPVANAGPGQNTVAGTAVTLDGSQSSDANADPLTYQWALTSRPVGSSASLANAATVKPTFTADLPGTYVASLVVSDGKVSSSLSTVTITASATNAAPVANAGLVQNVQVGAVVTLDGSGSTDANGDTLTYNWSLTSKPQGSATAIGTPTLIKPTFTADVVGTYVATLTVNDGKTSSASSTVAVTAEESKRIGQA
jgi:chitinase